MVCVLVRVRECVDLKVTRYISSHSERSKRQMRTQERREKKKEGRKEVRREGGRKEGRKERKGKERKKTKCSKNAVRTTSMSWDPGSPVWLERQD